jgi:hypothetical protein
LGICKISSATASIISLLYCIIRKYCALIFITD